jgi:hypothetical protein
LSYPDVDLADQDTTDLVDPNERSAEDHLQNVVAFQLLQSAKRWSLSLSLSTTGVAKEQKENCQVNDNQPSYFDFRTAKKLANNGSRRNDDMGAQ